MPERDDGDGRAFQSGNRTPTDVRARRAVVTTSPEGVPVMLIEEPPRTRSDTGERIKAAVDEARADVTLDHRIKALEATMSGFVKWIAGAVTGGLGSVLVVAGLLYGRGTSDGALHERIDRAIRDVERIGHDIDELRARELQRRSSLAPSATAPLTTSRIP